MRAAYKKQAVIGGVYCITNTVTGRRLAEATQSLVASRNRFEFSQTTGPGVPPALDDAAVAVAPRALFLIYAQNGGGGEELTPDYVAAAGEPVSISMVPGGQHTAGITERPQEYAQRVGGFFAETLLR